MNKKALAVICLIAVVVAGSFAVAQQPPAKTDSATGERLDKIIQQNEAILRQQTDILKQLEELKTQVGALRRRSS